MGAHRRVPVYMLYSYPKALIAHYTPTPADLHHLQRYGDYSDVCRKKKRAVCRQLTMHKLFQLAPAVRL